MRARLDNAKFLWLTVREVKVEVEVEVEVEVKEVAGFVLRVTSLRTRL
ncbi:MAG: hypothetical protein PHD00_12615 [Bacteroidales bacterium]|nr:hypothetical protein [Bacteroidales bacterium]